MVPRLIARCPLLFVLMAPLTVATLSEAADLGHAIVDYTIAAWTLRDGTPLGAVRALAQDRDGYLWLGGDQGLFRFDGATFTQWEPSQGRRVRALHAAADGRLWVGFADAGGLAAIHGASSTQFGVPDGVPKGAVMAIVEDPDGVIWAATEAGLLRFQAERWQAWEGDEFAGTALYGLFAGRDGSLYVGSPSGVFRRAVRGNAFEQLSALDPDRPAVQEVSLGPYPRSFAEDGAGAILVNDWNMGFRPVEASGSVAGPGPPSRGYRVMFDRDGQFWVGTIGQGLLRIRPGAHGDAHDGATSLTGLPSDGVLALLEDRDANLWVGTTEGLARLNRRRIIQVTDHRLVEAIEQTVDGSIWVATTDALLRFSADMPSSPTLRLALPSTSFRTMHADDRGRLWVATQGTLARFDGRLTEVLQLGPEHRLARIDLMSSDSRGGMWLYDRERGLFRMVRDHVKEVTIDGLGSTRIESLYTDRSGSLWMGLADGRVGVTSPAGTSRIYAVSDQLRGGICRQFFEDSRGNLWLAGTAGLVRFTNDRFLTLTTDARLPFNELTALEEDDQQNLWIGSRYGVVRIATRDFDEGVRSNGATLRYSLYNRQDGLAGLPSAYNQNRRVVRARDGRLWFVTSRGLSIVDPRALVGPQRPGPLAVESIETSGEKLRATTNLVLAPGTSRLEIRYSELNLTSPHRTKFRYRLEGSDAQWVDAGVAREATYTNLSPKQYRFHVAASTQDSGWTPSTVWTFSIAPQLHETVWFRVTGAAAGVLALWAAWQVRVRRMRTEFALVLGERLRLSRELHDTLLQSLVGVGFQLDAAVSELEPSSHDVRKHFVRLRRHVTENIREARHYIWDLRSPHPVTRNVVSTVREAAQKAADGQSVPWTFRSTGEPFQVSSKVTHQLHRICQEAMTNAIRHACAASISVALQFTDDYVELRVTDDGRGFDIASVGDADEHHYGLTSMRERAEDVGGELRIETRPGHGTRVTARVPAEGDGPAWHHFR